MEIAIDQARRPCFAMREGNMLRQRKAGTVLTGVGVWLAVALLAVAAGLLYAKLVSAQESSTEAALPAPALTAAAGEGAIELSWEAVSGAARYELWVWVSADGWQRLDDGALTGTTYSHTGLAADTSYYYAVRAVGARGETGDWSTYAAATQSSMAVPALTAKGGVGAVALRWWSVSGAERYELWVWTSADGWQRLDDGALTGTTYSHSGLAAGTRNYYAVRAVGAGGETSDWSAYASATVTAPPTVTATATVADTPTSAATILPTATATHTATPTATAQVLPPANTPTAASPPVLTATATHTATATATPTATATATVNSRARAIIGIVVSWGPSNDRSVDVFWLAPIETPVDYQVNWARADESYPTGAANNAYPAEPPYTITGLEDGRYKVRVRARYNGSFGPWYETKFNGPSVITPTPTATATLGG